MVKIKTTHQIDSSSKDKADLEDSQKQHFEECSAAAVLEVRRQHLDAVAPEIVVGRALQPKVLDYQPVVAVAVGTSSAVVVACGDAAEAVDVATVPACAGVGSASDDGFATRRGADYQGRREHCPGDPPRPLGVCSSHKQ